MWTRTQIILEEHCLGIPDGQECERETDRHRFFSSLYFLCLFVGYSFIHLFNLLVAYPFISCFDF